MRSSSRLAEPALADESPLVGDVALLGEQTLLGELAVEDEALLLGVEGPPPLLLLRRLLDSSMWAALTRSRVRARSLREQSWQKRAAGSSFPLELSQVAGSSLRSAYALWMSSIFATFSRQMAPSACSAPCFPALPSPSTR